MRLSIDSPRVQAISAELHRACREHSDLALWLAMDGSDQPLPEIDAISWTQRQVLDVRLTHPEIDPHWWPRWIALDLNRAEDSHILNHSIVWALEEVEPENLRAGHGRRVAGWLLSTGRGVEDGRRHWARAMIQRPANGLGNSFLLRLHDPTVLWGLWQFLKPEQRSAWLGPLHNWYMLDPTGSLAQLASAGPGSDSSEGTLSARLDVQQWQDVQNLTPLHQALQSVTAPNPLSTHDLQRLYQTGLQALRRANAQGVDDPHSLSLFAELALTKHPQFDHHPDLQRMLRQRTAEEPLGGLLCELTEQDWQRIVSELGAAANLA